jgi:hypothetical protein
VTRPVINEILVPEISRASNRLRTTKQMVRPLEKGRCNDSPSFIVSRLPTRTARPHGISGPEINRLNGAVRFMSLHCPRWGRLWWASLNKGSNRDLIADVQKRITKLQAQMLCPSTTLPSSKLAAGCTRISHSSATPT